MKPNRADIHALVTVLEREDLADAESMALELWDTMLEQLKSYTAYGVRVGYGTSYVAHGPFFHSATAEAYATKWRSFGFSASRHELRKVAENVPANLDLPLKECAECGDQKAAHISSQFLIGNSKKKNPPGCGVVRNGERCSCRLTFDSKGNAIEKKEKAVA